MKLFFLVTNTEKNTTNQNSIPWSYWNLEIILSGIPPETSTTEKIMTQKWLAIYPEGNEAWTEQRRTGYPKLFKVKVNNSGGAINTDEMIRRLPYPEGLKTSNPTQYSSLTRAL